MSLKFSDSANKAGIIELIDANCNTDSTQYPTADKTRDINLALDRVLALIFEVGGTWQFDDSNHTDYPILTTNLVSGQRDYSFTADQNSNLILEIYKVMIADPNGVYQEVYPVDVESSRAPTSFDDGLNIGGIPFTYDKMANGIFLDPIPNYNYTGGLKIYVSREGSYFAASDTTKKAGFAGLFHEYLALRPSYQYAFRKGLPVAAAFKRDMLEMEEAIKEYYRSREKDSPRFIRAIRRSSR